MKTILVGCTVLCFMCFNGCDKKTDAAKYDGHDHGKHDGHSHDETKKKTLGSVKIGGYEVTVGQEAPVVAGTESSFHVKISGGKVKAVSTWIGTHDGNGSAKLKAEPEGDDFHAHPKAPNPVPVGSALWIELETKDATKLVGSIVYQ